MSTIPTRPPSMLPGDMYIDLESGRTYGYHEMPAEKTPVIKTLITWIRSITMSKKTQKKDARWSKTPQRGIDLRVPLFVTDSMVADVEALLLNLVPGASTSRLRDSLSRYPWKDPEAEIQLDKVAVASSEEVYAEVIGDWPQATDSELSEQDLKDLERMHSEEPKSADVIRQSLEVETEKDIRDLDRLPVITVAGDRTWHDVDTK